MKDKKLIKSGYTNPKRVSFPIDEKLHEWLPALLNAYYIIDKGISEALKEEFKKGRKLACAKGCSYCCKTHETIPVYPLELVGLSWYATEKIKGHNRDILKKQLKQYKSGDPCPFLIDGICSIHSVRPISCRQFNVFGKPCKEGEDPYYTRREDVLKPIKKYIDHAFFIMLPFYGIKDENERIRVIETGGVHTIVKLLQSLNWKSLAEKMEEYDSEMA
ncbi:MAG: YkgJ family cysteine cluster protein [Nitrospirae bacterium]|jgi:Fe-S-cluster containining protein|nr:YkgJ family cysteine cluster protein [Nitrospirota bacterium]